MIWLPILRRVLPYLIGILVIFTVVVGLYRSGYSDGHDDTDATWQIRWSKQAADLDEATAQAERIQRTEEQRRQSAIDEVRTHAQEQIKNANDDARRAAAAADSLRERARSLAERAGQACGNPGAATGGTPAGTAAMVLADVLGRADQRAGELAAAFDGASIAGLACEAAYDKLTSSKD